MRADTNGVVFKVKVQPRAAKNQLAGLLDDALKIRLTAPPVDGAANEALCKYLSHALGVGRGDIELVAGHTGRNKLVRVRGLGRDELLKRLSL